MLVLFIVKLQKIILLFANIFQRWFSQDRYRQQTLRNGLQWATMLPADDTCLWYAPVCVDTESVIESICNQMFIWCIARFLLSWLWFILFSFDCLNCCTKTDRSLTDAMPARRWSLASFLVLSANWTSYDNLPEKSVCYIFRSTWKAIADFQAVSITGMSYRHWQTGLLILTGAVERITAIR